MLRQILIFAPLFFFAAPSLAADNLAVKNMMGTGKKIEILVEKLTDALTEFGLTREEIITVVELEFRIAGVEPVPDTRISYNPYFYINIICTKENEYTFACSIQTVFNRGVMFKTDSETWRTAYATVYNRSVVGNYGRSVLREALKEVVIAKTKEFLNNLLAANP